MARIDQTWAEGIYYPSEGREEWLRMEDRPSYSLDRVIPLSREEQIVLAKKHQAERE